MSEEKFKLKVDSIVKIDTQKEEIESELHKLIAKDEKGNRATITSLDFFEGFEPGTEIEVIVRTANKTLVEKKK